MQVAAFGICAGSIPQVCVAVLCGAKACSDLFATPLHTVNGLNTIPRILFSVEQNICSRSRLTGWACMVAPCHRNLHKEIKICMHGIQGCETANFKMGSCSFLIFPYFPK